MLRTLIAGIVGGIMIFIWGFVSHMVLQIGDDTVKALPNEETAMPALKATVNAPGMYMFPGPIADHSKESMDAWEKKMQAGPRGLLIIQPDPTDKKAMSLTQLGTELASNVLAGLLAAGIVSCVCGGFFRRVLVVTAIGLVTWASLSLSYWNWFWFPWDFTLGELMSEVPGWFLAGLFIAPIAPGCRPKPVAASPA